MAAVLIQIADARGAPQRLILDNGPERIAKALDTWAYAHGVELAFTRRGTPVELCFVESVHDNFQTEDLSVHWGLKPHDARHLIGTRRPDCCIVRPHQSLGDRTPAAFAVLCTQHDERESALTPPA